MKKEVDHDRAGRDAVGASFNPSNSYKVEELKNLFATLDK